MGNSAQSTPTFQALAGNIKNADGTTPIYASGSWDLRNASGTTTLAITNAGLPTFTNSLTTGTASDNQNITIKSVNRNSSITLDCPSTSYVASFIATNNGSEVARLKYSYSTKDWSFTGDGTNAWGGCTNGAWSFPINTTHIFGNGSGTTTPIIKALSRYNNDYGSGKALLQLELNGLGGFDVGLRQKTASGNKFFIIGVNSGDPDSSSTSIAESTDAGAWSNISGGSWGTISDERLKKNIIPLSSGLSAVLALKPVSYEWRDENVSELRPTTHFIAQDVELVNPKWVTQGGTEKITENGVEIEIENCKQVNLDASFNAYLVKAIQEQQAIIEDLKSRLATLELRE